MLAMFREFALATGPPETTDPPEIFRHFLLADHARQPEILAAIADPWQSQDFAALDGGWMISAGIDPGDRPIFKRAYLERPRGHSKTTDIAVMALWALFAAPRAINGLVASGDKDQAGLVRDAIERLKLLNPWLPIEVKNWEVENKATGSILRILASDASSNYGWTPDFVICDELTHWKGDAGHRFWTAIFSSVPKRENCLLVIIANAGSGMGVSWQWDVREAARLDPSWYFHRLEGPQATWQRPADLAEQQQMLAPLEYRRLWLNLWQTGVGDAISQEHVDACTTLTGPGSHGCENFVACLDIGVKRDHCAFVVLGLDVVGQRVKTCEVKSWRPEDGPGGHVDLDEVEAYIENAALRFWLAGVYYDPHQAAQMSQRLTRKGINMIEVVLSSAQVQGEMARTLVQGLRDGSIDLYDDPELLGDLLRIGIKETEWGLRLVAARDEHGHADRGLAMAMGLPRAFAALKTLAETGGDIQVSQWTG